jgi:SAM-dependent methyltransferase
MHRALDPYDAVAYPSYSYPDTHPDRLAVMAILHGLSPAPVARCRMLEIACNEGANLIPMAYAMPESEFVGFDLARLPIERGQQRICELGLKNIRIFAANLLDVGAELGHFDFIVAHGFYSWVPEPVRDRFMALCAELLTPHGVAFVSYNALPGGHLRAMVREMMLHSVEGVDDPIQRVPQALAFLHFLAETRPEGDAYRALFDEQIAQMGKRGPQVTIHDELSETNHQIYFKDFVRHAGCHGLQYLSEAVLPPPTDPCHRAEVGSALESAAGEDFLRLEQMLDFVRLRKYRETLLCRADCEVRRDYPPQHFRQLLFSSQVASAPGEAPGARVFTLPGGIRMESNHAGATALLEQLEAVWPRALGLEELEPGLSAVGFTLDAEGATLLMRLAVAKMIELHAWRAPMANAISARPRASASSRHEARIRPYATSLLHTTLRLDDPVVRAFLTLLDGSRTRADLLVELKAAFPAIPADALAEGIEPGLAVFQRAGFLEA